MKRLLAIVFLVSVLISTFCLAESSESDIIVEVSDFRYSLSGMCTFLSTAFPEADWHYSSEIKEVADKYLISEADNVRIISDMSNHNLCKISVRMEYNNQSAMLKQIAVAAVIEGQLYNKTYISESDKHRSLQYAQDIMDSMINLYADNITALYDDGTEGKKYMAANGRTVNYYYELIHETLYMTVQFIKLPDDII